jgi:sugar fermentation stimulation protein A
MERKEINSGSYQIIIKVKKDTEIPIGALGIITFIKGYYIYTGSAMKNLYQRVERHKRKRKKLRWHIDHLLNNESVEILDILVYPSKAKEECERNQKLLNTENSKIIAKGFGSSDCRICPTHLVYFKELSPLQNLKKFLLLNKVNTPKYD